MNRQPHRKANAKGCLHLFADAAMGDIQRRIVERVPSIGRGQILSAEDAPARIDAGIELELGPASDDRVPMRTWPEQVDPVHGRAGVSTSGPGISPALLFLTSAMCSTPPSCRAHSELVLPTCMACSCEFGEI